MHYEVGDIVYYNPSVDNLGPQSKRPRDRGTITKIKNGYAYVSFILSGYKAQILLDGLDYDFTSKKGVMYQYNQVLKGLNEAAIRRQNRIFKNIHKESLQEMLQYVDYRKYIDLI